MIVKLFFAIVLLMEMSMAHAAMATGGDNLAQVATTSFIDDATFSYRNDVTFDLATPADAEFGVRNLTDAVAVHYDQQVLSRTMMMPVPEPTALVLLLAGLVAIGAGRFAAPRSLLFK